MCLCAPDHTEIPVAVEFVSNVVQGVSVTCPSLLIAHATLP